MKVVALQKTASLKKWITFNYRMIRLNKFKKSKGTEQDNRAHVQELNLTKREIHQTKLRLEDQVNYSRAEQSHESKGEDRLMRRFRRV